MVIVIGEEEALGRIHVQEEEAGDRTTNHCRSGARARSTLGQQWTRAAAPTPRATSRPTPAMDLATRNTAAPGPAPVACAVEAWSRTSHSSRRPPAESRTHGRRGRVTVVASLGGGGRVAA